MKIIEKKLSPKEILCRGHFLYFGYYWLYTLCMDNIIAGCSLNKLACNEGEQIFPVQSASYRIMDQVVPRLHISGDDVFVDIGCGWGRLLGYMQQRKIRCSYMYGIEINKHAAAFTKHNFRNRKNIKVICGDATKVVLKNVTVFFLYNPFGHNVLLEFLNHIEKTCTRKIRLYYLHAVFEDVFMERSDRWRLINRIILTPKHHIPVVLCEYEFGTN